MVLNKSDIRELRGDLSPFLIHLTRTGAYTKWADIHKIATNSASTLSAKSSLEEIIKNSKLEARSPFGYFNYSVAYRGKNSQSQVQRSWLQSVCFTETPVDHIHIQCQDIIGRKLKFEPYGLAFFEAPVRSHNGSPVMYFDTNNVNIRQSLDAIPTSNICSSLKSTLPLYEGFGPPLYPRYGSPSEIDFRWEREWRVVGNFQFSLENHVAFGICPEEEIPYFENLVGNKFLFVDPSLSKLAGMKIKLQACPRLKDLIT